MEELTAFKARKKATDILLDKYSNTIKDEKTHIMNEINEAIENGLFSIEYVPCYTDFHVYAKPVLDWLFKLGYHVTKIKSGSIEISWR